MEVFLKDKLCGEQQAVHIGEGDTPAHLKATAFDVALGSPADALPEDVELSVDGEVLDDSTPLCGAAGVSQGCCIDVALSGARFADLLQKQFSASRSGSHVDMTAIPAWARGLRDVALAVVRCDGRALEHLESYRSDRHIVATAVRMRGDALQYASEDLRGDADIVLASSSVEFASPALFSSKPFVLTYVQRHLGIPPPVGAALLADREVVLAAVQYSGVSLESASESLRNDRQVAMAAGGGLRHASAALRNDKELVLRALRLGYDVAASESLCDNRDVMLTAVRQCGYTFHKASLALRNDTEFQREAVLWSGDALGCVPPPVAGGSGVPLHQDRELILAAVETCPPALEYADPSLQADREVVLAAMHSRATWGQCDALSCAPPHLKQDEEVVLAGVRRCPEVLNAADISLRSNRDFVLRCVKLEGRALEYADPSVSSDREVQLAAVTQDPSALEYCDKSIRSNRDLVLRAVQKGGDALMHASANLRQDRDIVLAAAKSWQYALEYADVMFRNDEEVVLAATQG